MDGCLRGKPVLRKLSSPEKKCFCFCFCLVIYDLSSSFLSLKALAPFLILGLVKQDLSQKNSTLNKNWEKRSWNNFLGHLRKKY